MRLEKRKLIQKNRKLEKISLTEVMRDIEVQKPDKERLARQWNADLAQKKKYDEQIQAARDQYREFIMANLEGRDIFNQNDVKFLLGFDERVTYKKPIFAMVKMLTKSLRAHNGSIIAAAAGYNAGCRTPIANRLLKTFGTIHYVLETVA